MIDNVRSGQIISSHRQRLGWTQGELARRLNVTHQAVSKWENGVAFPDITTLFELSRLFGVTMEQLLTGESLTPSSPDSASTDESIPSADKPDDELTEDPPIAMDWDAIMALAPFAARDTLDHLIAQCIQACDWNHILALAPFASRGTLDLLVSRCEDVCDQEHILALAPFLGHDTLDRLICSCLDSADWDTIMGLAPFLRHDTLDLLVSRCKDVCDQEHIPALAPFLGHDTLDRLLLTALPNTFASCSEAYAQADQETRRAERRLERRQTRHAEKTAKHSSASAAQTIEALRPLLSRHLDDEMLEHLTSYAKLADARRTEIAVPNLAGTTLEEYAGQIIEKLYRACDAADPLIGRLEEIRAALLSQDYAVLNEFASLLDQFIGPEWLKEYSVLCEAASDNAL